MNERSKRKKRLIVDEPNIEKREGKRKKATWKEKSYNNKKSWCLASRKKGTPRITSGCPRKYWLGYKAVNGRQRKKVKGGPPPPPPPPPKTPRFGCLGRQQFCWEKKIKKTDFFEKGIYAKKHERQDETQ